MNKPDISYLSGLFVYLYLKPKFKRMNTIKLEDILDYDMVLYYIDNCIANRANYPKEMMSKQSIKLNDDIKNVRIDLVNKKIKHVDAYAKVNDLIARYVDSETQSTMVYQQQVMTISTYL